MSPKSRKRPMNDRAVDRGTPADRGADRGTPADRGADRGAEGAGDDRNLSAEDRALEAQLVAAGLTARKAASAGPEAAPHPVYAAALRERLVTRLETAPPPFLAFTLRSRIARSVPIAVGALLLIAAIAAAGHLYIGQAKPTSPPPAATERPQATAEPTTQPSGTGEPTSSEGAPVVVPGASATPEVHPSVAPFVAPPPPPPPPPTPAPPETLTLALKSCDGGVVIGWSKSHASDFNHYTTLRSTSASIPPAYPPQDGAVDFGGTYTTDRFTLSAVDATGSAGTTYYYRTMAFNAGDGVTGVSAVGSATALPVVALGSLGVAPDPGGTAFAWTPYSGNGACFTWYKLVASTTNPDPSYTSGDGYLWYGSTQGDGATVVSDLASGTTYYFRIQVIKSAALGLFVAAQTDVTTYTIP